MMINPISEEIKKEIFRLISIPGIEVEDIPTQINQKFHSNLDNETVMKILSDEYMKYNLDFGRRLCCRF
jgi:5'-3' exonuclease